MLGKSEQLHYGYDGTEKKCEGQCQLESCLYEAEINFCKMVAAHICELLDINWIDRAIFEKILCTNLKAILNGRDGLLEQYLHTQLDIIANSVNTEFDLRQMTDEEKNKMPKHYEKNISDKGIGIDYDHAVHAKLSSIIKAIKIKHNIDFSPKWF